MERNSCHFFLGAWRSASFQACGSSAAPRRSSARWHGRRRARGAVRCKLCPVAELRPSKAVLFFILVGIPCNRLHYSSLTVWLGRHAHVCMDLADSSARRRGSMSAMSDPGELVMVFLTKEILVLQDLLIMDLSTFNRFAVATQ